MNRSTTAVFSLILAAVLFFCVNIFSSNIFHSARLDLTQEGLYTLSTGSVRILSEIPEPIRLRFYYSEKVAVQLPNMKSYGLRVRELLEEYVIRSDGKVKLEVIDPEPFTEAEDDAVRFGLQGAPVGTGENMYFGLVATNTVDDRQIIPFFNQENEAFLEYDMTRMIYNLSDPKKPTVGLITGLKMNADASPMLRFGGGPQPWAIVAAIRELFDLRTVDVSQGVIPKDLDILLIAHPLGLNDQSLYAIDQFVMRGGRALIFVDPYSEVTARSRRRGQSPGENFTSSDVNKLLKPWGVTVAKDHVIADYQAAQQVNTGQGTSQRIIRYLVWLQMAAENLNPSDVVTSNLGPMIFANAGTIRSLKNSTTKLTPLITTSKQAMRMDANIIRFGPAPDRLLELFKADGKSHMIAARLSGSVKSAFPDGPPKSKGGKQDKTAQLDNGEHLTQSSKDISLIVVADSDLLHDQFWLRKQNLFGQSSIVPISANADFLINALDNLSGSTDLINLRSRGKSDRPFTIIQAMRLDAERKFLAEERKLKKTLAKGKERIAELETRAKTTVGSLLTPEQQLEIKNMRGELFKTRKQLRDVQHNLNRDIERLESNIKFINVGLMPLVVAVIATVLATIGIRRRRKSAARN